MLVAVISSAQVDCCISGITAEIKTRGWVFIHHFLAQMTKGELERKNRYMGRVCCFQFVVKSTPLISATTTQHSELKFQEQGRQPHMHSKMVSTSPDE